VSVAAFRCALVFVAWLLLLGTSCAPRHHVVERAVLLADKGQTKEAVRLLDEHLAREPRAQRERRLLVRLLGAGGDLGRAEAEALKLAQQLGESSPTPWLELGHAYELAHRFDLALETYDRAAEVAPKDPSGPRTGGLRAAKWGEADWAAPRLAEALRRDPSDARGWHAYGLVLAKLGQLDGAERAYRSGVAADPRGLDNHIGLASLAILRDDAGAALTAYDIILRIEPRFADAQLGRSWALIRLGRWALAEQALESAERLGASRSSLARQRAWLARERGKSAGTP